MNAPAASVVVPCYRTSRYVAEALDSLRAQTFRSFETIVVNDGCPETEDLERALAPYRGEIVYIRQENGGISAAKNAGLRMARAPVVALLDSDDAFEPEYLASQIGMLADHPGVDVVYPDAVYFGDKISSGRTFLKLFPSRGEVTFRSLVERKCSVFGCSAFRLETVVRAGLYDVKLRSAEDLDLWLRMARIGARFLCNPKPLYRYRQRSGSSTDNGVDIISARIRVYHKHLASAGLSGEEGCCLREQLGLLEAQRDLTLGKRALYAHRGREALELFRRANRVLRNRRVRMAMILLRFWPELLYAYVHSRYPTERSYVH